MLGTERTSRAAAAALPNTERNEGTVANRASVAELHDKPCSAGTKPHPDNFKLVPVDDLGLWKALQPIDPISPPSISRSIPCAPTRHYIARLSRFAQTADTR